MVEQDVQVVGIDERVLRRGVEEIRRVAHDELIDRRAARDEHGRRSRRAPAGAAGALPGRGDRAGIAGHHRDVERADVDAELERVGGNDGAHLTLAQPALDFAAAIRQVAATIAADRHRPRPAGPETHPSDTSSGSRPPAGSARRESAAGCASGTRAPPDALRPDTSAGSRAAR